MNDPLAVAPQPDTSGIVEDFVDIFASPAQVFARRANANPMLPFLIVCAILIGLFFASRGAMEPIYQAQMQKARARTAKEAYDAQMALMRAQQGMVKTENKDIEIQATDDVVVRRYQPREEFDDKGKPKKYTKKEKLELKGPDKKLPGYTAEFGDISTDQMVQLTLVRKKGGPVVKAPRRVKGKDKDANAEADLMAENGPMASLIFIVSEPRQGK